MSDRLIRVDSPRAVEMIAEANGVSFTRTSHAASVTLTRHMLGTVCYFWTAA